MQTEDSQKIIGRFFDAIYTLINRGDMKGKKTFTDRFKINRWNFLSLEKDHSRDIFQPAWLSYLSSGYGVSAEWLLTGQGEMLSSTRPVSSQPRKA